MLELCVFVICLIKLRRLCCVLFLLMNSMSSVRSVLRYNSVRFTVMMK